MAALALLHPLSPARGEDAAARPMAETQVLFEGALQLRRADGGRTRLQAQVQRRHLARGARLAIPAGPGFTLVQLVSGTVKVTGGGETIMPSVDEFWMAGTEKDSTIEATSEEALLETVHVVPVPQGEKGR